MRTRPFVASAGAAGRRFVVGLAVVASVLATACTPPAAPPPGPEELPEGYEVLEGNYGGGSSSTGFTLLHDTTRSGERLVVFVHGGAWNVGSRGLLPHSIRRLVNHGYAVATIDYPLHGVQRHPEQVRYVKDALSWFHSNAAALGIGSGAPIVSGFSAGGHLAALAATTGGVGGFAPHSGSEVVPGAVVLMAAPVDLVALNNSPDIHPVAQGANAGALTSYLDGSCAVIVLPNNPACNGPLTEASPVHHLTVDDPPFYAVYAADDERISTTQASILQQAAGAVGVTVQVVLGAAATPVAECVEYSGAAGCDSDPWFHSAVPRMVNTSTLANWLIAMGLPA